VSNSQIGETGDEEPVRTTTADPSAVGGAVTLTTTPPSLLGATTPSTTTPETATTTPGTTGAGATTPGTTTSGETTPSTTLVELDDEAPAPGPAGVIQAITPAGGQPDRSPSWSELPLAPVDPPDPDPVPLTPLGDAPGGKVVNGYGCQLSCIQHALILPDRLHADVGLDLATKVPTSAYVFVSETEPVMGPHGPIMSVWANPFHLDETTTWSATTTGLQFDTTYWISILVIDDQDNERWAMGEYHTVANPIVGQEAAAGSECYFGCLTGTTLRPGDTPWNSVDVEIRMTSAAPQAWAVVSTADPVYVDGVPTLEYQGVHFEIVEDGGDVVHGRATWLTPDTAYHVLVTAVDDSNVASYAVGEFRTEPAPDIDVRVRWERVYIHHDGDPGAHGRGELSMRWGLGFDDGSSMVYGTRSEEKIGDDTAVVLDDANQTWVSTEEGGEIPSIILDVTDRDGVVSNDEGCIGTLTMTPIDTQPSCARRTNAASIATPSLAEIRALPSCAGYGLVPAQNDDRCLVLRSERADDDFPTFDVLVSFHLVEA